MVDVKDEAESLQKTSVPQAATAALTNDEVCSVIKQVLDETIGGSNYSHTECANLNQNTVENITKKLVALNRPYKYIVTSSLLQIANGSGLNVSTISYWNKSTDLTFQYRWETRHNLCVVYVFAVAL